jgi:hypothetical protein
MAKAKSKPQPMAPHEINQVLKENEYKKSRERFLNAMNDEIDPTAWDYDPATRKHYIDDGNMYDGDEQGRKFMLVEIQDGAGPGFNPFPHLGHLLFVKGTRVASDTSLVRLKEMAEKMVKDDGKDNEAGD